MPAYKTDERYNWLLIPEAQAKGDKSLLCVVRPSTRRSWEARRLQKLSDGMNYNLYFPGNQIAMASATARWQSSNTQDRSPATVDQYSKDVTAFLAWAADPKLEERKRIGLMSMLVSADHDCLALFREEADLVECPALTGSFLLIWKRPRMRGPFCFIQWTDVGSDRWVSNAFSEVAA